MFEKLRQFLRIFGLCAHTYEVYEKIDVIGKDSTRPPANKLYILRCTHCGKLSRMYAQPEC